MTDPHDKSLMRSLGEFVGHIVRGVKAPVGQPPPSSPAERHEVKREVQEETRQTPEGMVTLRRTTIEEIEYQPDDARTPPPARPAPPGSPPHGNCQQ